MKLYPVDPNVLINLIKQGQNPQQLMLAILQGQADTPLGKNLLNLAQSGRTDELEKVVRNIYAQQGGQDFDQEFQAFKRALGYKN
jgi:hypothetical protein